MVNSLKSKKNSLKSKTSSKVKSVKSKVKSKTSSKTNSVKSKVSSKTNSVKSNVNNNKVYEELNIKNNKGYKKIGILDPFGENINPLTGKPYENMYVDAKSFPNTYAGYAKLWSTYPVYEKRYEFIEEIKKNQVTLVISGTGSGKTVLTPKFALHALDYKGKIAVTIPRTGITRDAAEFAAKTLDVPLGKQVGYKFRGSDPKMAGKNPNLLYTTDGSLVARATGDDPLLEEFNCIIVDEAHERSVNIDFLLLILKEIVKKRKDFKVIIMSATINANLFKNYFSEKEISFNVLDAGEATTHEITDIYAKDDFPESQKRNYLQYVVEKVFEILSETDSGDILAFVLGDGDAKIACQDLRMKMKNIPKNKDVQLFCADLSAKTPDGDRNVIVKEALYKELGENNGGPFNRRVIFGSNAVESSITIDGLEYVVDCGFEYTDCYDPSQMVRYLTQKYITKAQVRQRRGRVGRSRPGTCYYLYSEKQYNTFKDYPLPAILKSDLSSDFLRMFNDDDVNTIQELIKKLKMLIEPPTNDIMAAGFRLLQALNVIEMDEDGKDGRLTNDGQKLAKLGGMTPQTARMIYESWEYHVSNECTELGALLEETGGKLDSVFIKFRPSARVKKMGKNSAEGKRLEKEEEDEHNKIKRQFMHSYGDIFSIFKAYLLMKKYKKDENVSDRGVEKWCKENKLKYKTLRKVHSRSMQMKSMLSRLFRTNRDYANKKNNNASNVSNVSNVSNGASNGASNISNNNQVAGYIDYPKTEDRIMHCLFQGYFMQIALQSGKDRYTNCFPKVKTTGRVDRDSFYGKFIKDYPKHVIFYEMSNVNNNIKLNLVNKIPQAVLTNATDRQKEVINMCKANKRNNKGFTKKKFDKKSVKKGKRKFTKK